MKNFILAARPKTLLAGAVPPTVSYMYYLAHFRDSSQVFYYWMCLIGVLAIQIATNFFNDVIDHQKGADLKRVGPTRVSAAGLVDIKTVKIWAYAMVTIAFLCGIPIILRGGWPFLVLGLISLFLTYGYTGGKISLAYRGLGELFVFIFFGLFSAIGSFYLYARGLPEMHLVRVITLGCIFGCLTNTFIMVNNLRDRETDLEVGKRTLATKMRPELYKILTYASIFFPYLLLTVFAHYHWINLTFLALIPAIKLVLIVKKKFGMELNEGLKFAGIHLLVFSILLSVVFFHGYPIRAL
jgi:1,4-dihydroxy-2-naphthoate polyprenyltransferase